MENIKRSKEFFNKNIQQKLQQTEDEGLQKIEDVINEILRKTSTFSKKDRDAVLELIP